MQRRLLPSRNKKGLSMNRHPPLNRRCLLIAIYELLEPFQHMKNAKGLATAEFYDHGFVFH